MPTDIDPLPMVARLLVCSWRLGPHGFNELIPDPADLSLDRAIERAVAAGLLPDWAAEALHFADGSSGRVCVELFEVLSWASVHGIVEYSFHDRGHRVYVSPDQAGRFLERLGVSVEEATRLGEFLAEEMGLKEKEASCGQ